MQMEAVATRIQNVAPLVLTRDTVGVFFGRPDEFIFSASFAFPSLARQKRGMPERPGDPPPRARVLTDRERAEAAQLREIVQKAPPLPAVKPPFPVDPPWSARLADLAHFWLSVVRMPRQQRTAPSLPRRRARVGHALYRNCRSPEMHELRRATVIGRARRRRDDWRSECRHRERNMDCG
jgi:hypothetical protein